ncbi:XRE family transcriptional regulator (plasmid) [Sulfurimonas aquatica]|uniref:XRE family transcriptional regulator n=1 Tax=Sulfurimonas aquatica TaxID=2672570 RepID=A0A975B2W8_9BACT|nr:helix-turn-helix transcriptional regulator [Sulfurimonas aquatica]QSZ43155.1 XRE family transcriptional regulator [Sulfurimonas aquatica]
MQSKFDNDEEIEEFYKLVSNNVKKYRLLKGMTQMDLGLEIGIKSVAFFSNCESLRYGKHFNIEHIFRLSKVLDKEICDFF